MFLKYLISEIVSDDITSEVTFDSSLRHVFVLQWSTLLPLNIININLKQYTNYHLTNVMIQS